MTLGCDKLSVQTKRRTDKTVNFYRQIALWQIVWRENCLADNSSYDILSGRHQTIYPHRFVCKNCHFWKNSQTICRNQVPYRQIVLQTIRLPLSSWKNLKIINNKRRIPFKTSSLSFISSSFSFFSLIGFSLVFLKHIISYHITSYHNVLRNTFYIFTY